MSGIRWTFCRLQFLFSNDALICAHFWTAGDIMSSSFEGCRRHQIATYRASRLFIIRSSDAPIRGWVDRWEHWANSSAQCSHEQPSYRRRRRRPSCTIQEYFSRALNTKSVVSFRLTKHQQPNRELTRWRPFSANNGWPHSTLTQSGSYQRRIRKKLVHISLSRSFKILAICLRSDIAHLCFVF